MEGACLDVRNEETRDSDRDKDREGIGGRVGWFKGFGICWIELWESENKGLASGPSLDSSSARYWSAINSTLEVFSRASSLLLGASGSSSWPILNTGVFA